MRHALSCLVVLLLLLHLPLVGSAQDEDASRVLFFCDPGHVQSEYCGEDYWVWAHSVYEALGAEWVHASTLPEDLTDFDLVFITILSHQMTPNEVLSLFNYLRWGRRLVLHGENLEFFPDTNDHLNTLLAFLDVSARFAQMALDMGCPFTTEAILPHRLTTGVEAFDYGYATSVVGGTPLIEREGGQVLVAIDTPGRKGPPNGEIILIGDMNWVIEGCPRGNNEQLLRNLIDYDL